MMNLIVNGEPFEHFGDGNLAALLNVLDVNGDRVATMVNDEIIARENRRSAGLRDGDRVEVLVFAGGG